MQTKKKPVTKSMVDTRNDAWRRNRHMLRLYTMLAVLTAVLSVVTIIVLYMKSGTLWMNLPEDFQGTEADLPAYISQQNWDTAETIELPMWDEKGEPIPMPEQQEAGAEENLSSTVFYYGGMEQKNGVTRILLKANRKGMSFFVFGKDDELGQKVQYARTVPFFDKYMVIEGEGYFEGSDTLALALIIFLGALSAVTGYVTLQLRRRALFSYRMVVNGGICLFATFQFILFLFNFLLDFRTPSFSLFNNLVSAMGVTARFISPVMLVAVLAVAVSNLQLIRHEGFQLRNLLGIFLAVAWIACLVILGILGGDYAGSWEAYKKIMIMDTLLSVLMNYAFFLLLSTVINAYLAQKHQPIPDKDYIIILGCRIRKDGTPAPLLQGRVDRAIDFEKEQFEKTGRHAVFVPSGGQGPDEVISEAESMRRYLLSRGIPDEQILPEDQSVNTFQNIRNSKKLILERDPEARAAFSTTNYHVFRSYVLSKDNDFYAEGMASKTKNYYFPNAFLREFFGLLYSEKIPIILVLALITCVYGTFAMLI